MRSREHQRGYKPSDASPTPTVGPKGESDAAMHHARISHALSHAMNSVLDLSDASFQLGPTLRVRRLSKLHQEVPELSAESKP